MQALISILVLPPMLMFDGYVLSKLWAWFIVPAFAAPALTIPVAIGITIIAAFLNYRYTKSGDDEWAGRIGAALGVTLWVWALGACVHAFMP